MNKVWTLVWNLGRLGLGVGAAALLVAAIIYAILGRWAVAVGLVTLMVSCFFAINVANFLQYRWKDASGASKTMVLVPLIGALGAVGASTVSTTAALATVGTVVAYWLAATRRRPDLASSKVPARLVIDEEGVQRMYANMELDGIQWEEMVKVQVSPEADRRVVREDDFYFYLVDGRDEICLVPNGYALELLPRLQRLPGFDNEALVAVATGDIQEATTVWEGQPGSARRCSSEAP